SVAVRALRARLAFTGAVAFTSTTPGWGRKTRSWISPDFVTLTDNTEKAADFCPATPAARAGALRSEEHTSELQSRGHLVCRLLPLPPSPLFPYTTLFRSSVAVRALRARLAFTGAVAFTSTTPGWGRKTRSCISPDFVTLTDNTEKAADFCPATPAAPAGAL